MIGRAQAVTRTRGLDVSEVEDGLVITAAGGADVVHLNGAASLIFELCDHARTVDEIVTAACSEVPDGSLGAADVRGCIDQFVSLGLVRASRVRRGHRDAPADPEPAAGDAAYDHWLAVHAFRPDRDRAALEERLGVLDGPVLVDLRTVATTDDDLASCATLIRSLQDQVTARRITWQLTIAVDAPAVAPGCDGPPRHRIDQDPRVRVGRATGLDPAERVDTFASDATWTMSVRPDDVLAPHALAEIVLAEHHGRSSGREIVAVYGDEDHIDRGGRRTDPIFKPGPGWELMRSTGYAASAIAYRTERTRALGTNPTNGLADAFDTTLRVLETWGPTAFLHVPDVLVHRGRPPLPVGEAELEHRSRVLQDHLDRIGEPADVARSPSGTNLRVRHRIEEPCPLVSILVPTRDRLDLLEVAVGSILRETTYPSFEVVVLDNDSVEPATLDWLAAMGRHPAIEVRSVAGEFNFSRIGNDAVAAARGEIVAFVNNDIEVTDGEWLTELVSWVRMDRVGAAGAMLRYASGAVQHAGIIMGLGGLAGHSHRGSHRDDRGYMDRLDVEQNVLGVTAACLAMRASVFQEVGGLDEMSFPIAFNDVDLCLRVVEAGYDIVWTPAADVVHHESVSRGEDLTSEQRRRARAEGAALRARWVPLLDDDPFYSPHLTREFEDFSIARPTPTTAGPSRPAGRRAIVHAGMASTGTASLAAAVRGYDDGTVVALGGRSVDDVAADDGGRSVLFTTADVAVSIEEPDDTDSSAGDARWSPTDVHDVFASVTVFGLVRDVGGHLRAGLQDAVRRGVGIEELDAFYPHYRRWFGGWFDVVDARDVHLLPYLPDSWPSGCAVAEFARRVGLRDLTRSVPGPLRCHRSDSAEVSAVLHAYRVGHLRRHGVPPAMAVVEAAGRRLAPLGRHRLDVGAEVVARVAAAHAADLDWAAARLLSGVADPHETLLTSGAGLDRVTITDVDDLLELAVRTTPELRRLVADVVPTRRSSSGGSVDQIDEIVDLVDGLVADLLHGLLDDRARGDVGGGR